ncbi:lipoprotein YvcA [Bacillus changyiensis]|uniref:lipoprotein YvcA n=1 Tax=Bacillus changyiensis TaxID=3004103 RepID=UPI0022E3F9A8|nr:lipoprotein YvcA [Bacillus changyiensis]MDA1476735.1 lipoprotein YvcA [Bacillus changyiensis]
MKKMIIICFTLMLAMTGGCSMNDKQNSKEDNNTEAVKPIDIDPKDLPKVPAFQDKETRKYMASTKEVEPGYYLLESKLNGFTIAFPDNGKIVQRLTENDGENYESIVFEGHNSKTNIYIGGDLSYYYKTSIVDNIEMMLDAVKGQNGYKGDFDKIEKPGKEIYFAFTKTVFNNPDRKYNDSYMYFGYIKSTEVKHSGIDFSFIINCHDDKKPCILNEKKAKAEAKKMIDSITFNVNNKEQKNGK